MTSAEGDDEYLYYQKKYDAFLTKTRMNDVPLSPKEVVEIQTDLSGTRSDLQCCGDDNIRALLSKIMECQESLLSPIRKLPSDILGVIFDLVALPMQSSRLDTDLSFGIVVSLTDKIVGRVFILTWICSWWRRQALAQPTLWSSIYLVDSQRNNDVGEEELMKLEVLNCILHRSGTICPMDVRLDISTRLMITRNDTLPFLTIFSSVPFDHIQNSIIEVLTDCASRWRSFTFRTNSSTNFEAFHEVLGTKLVTLDHTSHFPFLERIDIGSDFRLNDESRAVMSVRTTFSSCHHLRLLAMHSLASTDSIELQNLTVLEVCKYSGPSFAYLLHKCPMLQSLTVQFFIRRQDLSQDPPYLSYLSTPLRYPHLRTLKIKGMGEEFASGAWDTIHLPSLEKVIVSFWLRMGENALDELQEMLIRSDCPLRKVQLLWNSFHISEYSTLERFIYGIPFSQECEYYINEGRYPRTH
ncbi:hypothetical protein J3R30DRAFT_2594047 [Lentinula aciculospora]|uniref:F-box domain-containing protein n=1 Tax=Lentinula aciculospora TaxID=153920 RepID=A0A9W9AED2_9AGAR|nr:hypothetical protein J3R30DRAFT_2594047 [Lentinula aciculospora]